MQENQVEEFDTIGSPDDGKMDEPFMGLDKSGFTPTIMKSELTESVVDKLMTFTAEAAKSWILAGMPMDKSMALAELISDWFYVVYGKSNLESDISNIMAAYAGRDRLNIRAVERISTNTHQESLASSEAGNVFARLANKFSGNSVKPTSGGGQ